MIPSPARNILLAGAAILGVGGCQSFDMSSPSEKPSWSIVRVYEDFSLDEPGEAWSFRTPVLWRVSEESGRRFLQMAVPPPRPLMAGVRRPQEYAIYNKFEFRSFSLACYVRIERDPAVRGRDACIIFSRRDNTHFYYAHLSNFSDAFHNNLVRVDGATRQPLIPADVARRPAITDRQWHRVDVVRDVDAGTIRVYVDLDRDRTLPPVFEVEDRTYEWGFIGLGSFDDHASFACVAIEGQARRPSQPPVMDRPGLGMVLDAPDSSG